MFVGLGLNFADLPFMLLLILFIGSVPMSQNKYSPGFLGESLLNRPSSFMQLEEILSNPV